MWAAAQKQPEMIRAARRARRRVDARGRAHDWQRRVTAEPRIKIMHVGGFTPLLYAAREGCVACVEAARRGRRRHRSRRIPYGMTPLVLALYNRHFDTAAADRARRRRQSLGLVGPQPAVPRDRAEPDSG